MVLPEIRSMRCIKVTFSVLYIYTVQQLCPWRQTLKCHLSASMLHALLPCTYFAVFSPDGRGALIGRNPPTTRSRWLQRAKVKGQGHARHPPPSTRSEETQIMMKAATKSKTIPGSTRWKTSIFSKTFYLKDLMNLVGSLNHCITSKFARCLSSGVAETRVNFECNQMISNTNLKYKIFQRLESNHIHIQSYGRKFLIHALTAC